MEQVQVILIGLRYVDTGRGPKFKILIIEKASLTPEKSHSQGLNLFGTSNKSKRAKNGFKRANSSVLDQKYQFYCSIGG